MSYDNEWLEQTLEARNKAVRESIRPTTIEELKKLASERFPSASDLWAENYRTFLDENPKGEFYLATTSEGAEVVYCHDSNRGIWFLPGKGMGIVQAKGLKLLAEIVSGR